MYKLEIKAEKILGIIIVLVFLYLSYLCVMFLSNTNTLKSYANTDTQMKQITQDIVKTDSSITKINEEIIKIDEFLVKEQPTADQLKSFHANNIMYNILSSTNNGTKLNSILVAGKQMEISGVSKKIDEVSALVSKLSKYYNVDINKTQQINHNNDGTYYAFKTTLTERGSN